MLGNTVPRPSSIENKIYDIMDDYTVGIDTYEAELVMVIADYFNDEHPKVEWNLCCSEWPDLTGGACFVSWIESGHLRAICFDYDGEAACV